MTLAPYHALATVYDRWTAGHDYAAWCDYLRARFPQSSSVLDICCGTGTMIRLLQELGYTVAGVDRSAEMLDRARAMVAPGTTLLRQDLSASATAMDQYDAAVCCFDSVNYFVTDDALGKLFGYAAASVRTGGVFVFDVNTRRKLESLFGDSHYGDDLCDFAYVWRNRYDAELRRTEFLITLFTKHGDAFARHEEHHVQRWFTEEELRAVSAAHGFDVLEVADDYTDHPAFDESLRQTWVLRRR